MQQVRRSMMLVAFDVADNAIDLVIDVVKPQLRGLVHHLEKPLVRIGELFDRLLQLEQFGNAHVALVVAVALPFKDRSGMWHGRAS